ncbi:MAG: hypothetical protein ACOX88_01960 [Christensenellales bacterium]
MKKALILMIACAVLLAGCSAPSAVAPDPGNRDGAPSVSLPAFSAPLNSPDSARSDDILEIKEKMFIAQTNDIYLNPEDYLGRTIKYEGIFGSFKDEVTGAVYYYVIRYGPGCCAYDSNAGFEIAWSGDYPKENDWVEAIGVLEQHEDDGIPYLVLNLSSLTVLDTRGQEYVYQ